MDFDRGDIVVVGLDPTEGGEQQGTRPALVITKKEFNRLGCAMVVPITQGGNHARYAGFATTLSGTGCKTQGVVLINQIRTLDLKARKARKIERAPDVVMQDVMGRLMAILEDE